MSRPKTQAQRQDWQRKIVDRHEAWIAAGRPVHKNCKVVATDAISNWLQKPEPRWLQVNAIRNAFARTYGGQAPDEPATDPWGNFEKPLNPDDFEFHVRDTNSLPPDILRELGPYLKAMALLESGDLIREIPADDVFESRAVRLDTEVLKGELAEQEQRLWFVLKEWIRRDMDMTIKAVRLVEDFATSLGRDVPDFCKP